MPLLERLPTFLHQAYNLKAVADYETGVGSDITLERAIKAVDDAKAFVVAIREVLEPQA